MRAFFYDCEAPWISSLSNWITGIIYIPRTTGEGAVKNSIRQRPNLPGGTITIMLVEDVPAVREMTALIHYSCTQNSPSGSGRLLITDRRRYSGRFSRFPDVAFKIGADHGWNFNERFFRGYCEQPCREAGDILRCV